MSIRLYFLRAGPQACGPFFGDYNKIYARSASIKDEFPAKVLLEANKRYLTVLTMQGVDKLSIFCTDGRSCGWHSSLKNPHYHYTLHGYNRQNWMAVTLEMEVGNQGTIYTYQARHWNQWLARAGGQAQLKAKYFFDSAEHVEGRKWRPNVYYVEDRET
ncbi:hypothetical protein EDD18DRAFT_1110703 [Armillaria luteobubalina]|uniref:Uncharacterized protein n=1 Tax=Armillaria luteobubalina TaxID=153913 RepID=A0AA39UG77_9AGAR|nr:hypothetical protein EDD18DRAFT_1110703 [Armillaria luteobubalina]